ncbi:MAG: DNA internalization-related competence protein ComEC/Rec2 [Clostridia bacterium]|nr:DNA internalization-related competence protein ComEC/Rec2 [Clostridia bacterium]
MKPGLCSRIAGLLKKGFASEFDRLSNFADRRRIAVIAFGALLGLLVSRLGQIHFLILVICALLAIMIVLVKNRGYRTVLPAVIALIVFGMLYQCANERPSDLPVGHHSVNGVICQYPVLQQEDGRTVYTLDNIVIDGKERSYKLRLYLYDTDPVYYVGDVLSFDNLKITVPSGVRNPNGFNFNQYLWTGKTALVANANPSDISVTGRQMSVKRILTDLRTKLALICDDVFLEQSDVVKAVLIGDKSTISESLYTDFSSTGISHVLALSGLHVSMIALLLEWVFSKLYCPRTAKHILITLLLWAYTVMTGSSPSTVRALIMYAITCFTIEMGYRPDTMTTLSWTFLLQSAYNPLLIGNTGFIMSYASVFAILLIVGIRNNSRQTRLSKVFGRISDAARASFAVQVLTFPLLASLFYGIPLLSVPINMICVPLAVLALYMGFVILLIGLLSVNIACALAFPVRLIWAGIKAVSTYAAKLPFAYILSSAWPPLLIALYAVIAFSCSVYLTASKERRVTGICALLIIAFLTLLPGDRIEHLKVTFLDVGSADCTVLNAQGDVYIVDAGKDNSVAADYLISNGQNLRGIFLTHTDIDHYGGIFDILRRFPKASIYLPECWDRQNVNDRLLEQLYGRNIYYLSAGDTVNLSNDVSINVLWPYEGFDPPIDNDGSMVMNVSYKDTAMLLTADIGDKYDHLCAAPSQILKVSHHGSKYATTEAFLDINQPQTAVISVGNNSFGHPTKETLSRLAAHGSEVYRTDYLGAITIDIYDDGVYTVSPYLTEGK